MNILYVGNSFAVDASTYVHQIAKAIGEDINVYVLYIPGCPIDKHWHNFLSKEKAYEFYVNGDKNYLMYCDIFEGLQYQRYDFVSFQQRSGDSVDSSTFFPELNQLTEGVRQYTEGTYVLHKTWSYAKSFSHDRYGSNPMNQDAMDKDIEKAYKEASEKAHIPYIVPVGEAIKLARQIFGDNLTRDGYHLNERGRVLAGIVWVMYVTGKVDFDLSSFNPSGYTYDDVTPPIDKEEIKELMIIAKRAIKNNKGYNLFEE